MQQIFLITLVIFVGRFSALVQAGCPADQCCQIAADCSADFADPIKSDPSNAAYLEDCPWPACPRDWVYSSGAFCREIRTGSRIIPAFTSLANCEFAVIPGTPVSRSFCMDSFNEAFQKCLYYSGTLG